MSAKRARGWYANFLSSAGKSFWIGYESVKMFQNRQNKQSEFGMYRYKREGGQPKNTRIVSFAREK
jgi:predicted dithiol-disulfide oxidoreductase (DUF899 family)